MLGLLTCVQQLPGQWLVCGFFTRGRCQPWQEERRIIPWLVPFRSLHCIFLFCKSFFFFCSWKGNRPAPGLQIMTDQWYVGRIQSSCRFRVQFYHHLWLEAKSKHTVSWCLFIVEERAAQYIYPGRWTLLSITCGCSNKPAWESWRL